MDTGWGLDVLMRGSDALRMRISKLVLLLGSENDGECAAAVAELFQNSDLLAKTNGREALARFRSGHPRLGVASPELIRKEARLADARWVVAREYGFASWARFKAHVEALGGKTELRHPFETDLQYYRDRAAGMLSVFGTGEQNAIRLVRLFHPDFASASEADLRAVSLTQADAELILAREHGFETFEAFAAHIGAIREQRVSAPFAQAFDAIKADERARLQQLLARHPKLANAAGTNANRLIMLAMSFGRLQMPFSASTFLRC